MVAVTKNELGLGAGGSFGSLRMLCVSTGAQGKAHKKKKIRVRVREESPLSRKRRVSDV